MFVAKEDFSLLSEERRIEFYKRAHELGFEHVEASSWNDPAGRNGYMIAYSVNTPGSEAMYTFMPKAAPRATRSTRSTAGSTSPTRPRPSGGCTCAART
ncbi:MAG: hypothetical protein M5T61_18630 [Acidimicrobiia bacterium]|nr:hypothetical protein [Acidimicrobiia bacterium]